MAYIPPIAGSRTLAVIMVSLLVVPETPLYSTPGPPNSDSPVGIVPLPTQGSGDQYSNISAAASFNGTCGPN